MKNAHPFSVRKPQKKDHLEGRRIWKDIIRLNLKISRKCGSELNSSGSGQGPEAFNCEYSEVSSCSTNVEEVSDLLSDY